MDTQDKETKPVVGNEVSTGRTQRKKRVFWILIAALFGVLIITFLCVIVILPILPLAYNNLGKTYYTNGNLDGAISCFDKAIQLKPDYAEAYNNRGNAYDDKGDHDRAITDYDKAIQLDPNGAEPYFNRGLAFSNKGDLDKAIHDYDQAIQLKPDYAKAYYNRGVSYDTWIQLASATE